MKYRRRQRRNFLKSRFAISGCACLSFAYFIDRRLLHTWFTSDTFNGSGRWKLCIIFAEICLFFSYVLLNSNTLWWARSLFHGEKVSKGKQAFLCRLSKKSSSVFNHLFASIFTSNTRCSLSQKVVWAWDVRRLKATLRLKRRENERTKSEALLAHSYSYEGGRRTRVASIHLFLPDLLLHMYKQAGDYLKIFHGHSDDI